MEPRHPRTNRLIAALSALALSAGAACLEDNEKKGGGGPKTGGAVADPSIGATDFVSADGDVGRDAGDKAGDTMDGAEGAPGAAPQPEGDAAGGEGGRGADATVEEGDIYRVLEGGRILNLNTYRGLQVIDVADPAAPAIVGRLQVTGDPVELYALPGRALVLLNNWQGYYGVRGAALPQSWNGGLVLDVDLSDPAAPTVTDRQQVPGYIAKSRLVRDGDKAALYVVAQDSGVVDLGGVTEQWRSSTVVKSFGVLANGGVEPRSEMDLGGWIVDIQATPEVLMVARTDWERDAGRSRVALYDISSPEGDMAAGADVLVRGQINNQFNMDVYNHVLRVVSDGMWNGGRGNHVETFDVTDLLHPEAIDRAEFGEGENLFATLFLGNKAFFVTYFRTDPFHAFEIDDNGNLTERAEFVVTGWNDFFRAVQGAERLIGVGVNDEAGRAQAVSLYDITDLDNAEPLLGRATVDAQHSWSEAQWDHRAFSVLEGVVAVEAAGGQAETGLVLLPFQGWDDAGQEFVSGVQIFTFGQTTVTRRGVMDHGTPVRRSFQVADHTPANLSEEELSLFDATDPDRPAELGRLELAPAYNDFVPMGGHGVRLKDTSGYWGWWGDMERVAIPPAVAEIVALADDPDSASPIASFDVPTGARLHRIDDQLLAVVSGSYQTKDQSPDRPTLETTVAIWDLSDAAHPAKAGELVTTDIPESFGGYYGGPAVGEPMADIGGRGFWGGWAPPQDVRVVGDALVFVEMRPQQRLLGREHVCNLWPRDGDGGCVGGGGSSVGRVPTPTDDAPDAGGAKEPAEEAEPEAGGDAGPGEPGDGDERPADEDVEPAAENDCRQYQGGITCSSLEGAPEVCQGRIELCGDEGGQWSCDPVDEEAVELRRDCWDNDLYRYWASFAFRVVDVSDPGNPSLHEAFELAEDREAVSVLAKGSSLYATWKTPAEVEGDARAFVRYHFVELDLSNPGAPALGGPVNIPGELIEIEGETVFTRDVVYGEDIVETALNRLTVVGGRARLDARRRFSDQEVQAVALDGQGRLLVSHRQAWHGGWAAGDVAVGVSMRAGGGAAPSMAGGGASEGASAPAPAEEAPAPSEAPNPEEREFAVEDEGQRLTILDASAAGGLSVLSEVPVDVWAQFQGARAGKALFSVPGGLLVVDVSDAAAPEAQAYFPTRGWPSRIVTVDGDAYVPAGRYGVYRFGLDVRNLLAIE